jgi:hypothetical protein
LVIANGGSFHPPYMEKAFVVRRVMGIVGCISLVVVSACSGASRTSLTGSAASGAEGGPCRSNGRCQAGLVCMSNVCVPPDEGADASMTGMAEDDREEEDASTTSTIVSDSGTATAPDTGLDAGFDAAQCVFMHPLVDGALRTCSPGACYCAGKDSCYPTAIAMGCCEGAQVVCY